MRQCNREAKMTEPEVIALARSVGAWRDPITATELARIVTAAVEAEREGCAKLVEAREHWEACAAFSKRCAAAIRGRT